MSRWRKESLKNITTLMTDGNWIESKDQSPQGIRLIQTGNIGIGEFIKKANHAKYISDETFIHLNCTEVFKGDVLVSRLPTPVGRACVIPLCNTKMITAVDCTIIRFDEQQCLPKYFVYFSISPQYLFQIEKYIAGSTRVRISRKHLETIMIPLPPLDMQKKITEVLDMAQELIDKRKRQIELLDNFLQSLFIEMFGDPVNNPKGWELKQIGEITKVSTGGTPSRDESKYWDGGTIPWVKTTEINKSTIYSTQEYITDEGLNNSNTVWFPVNSILIAMYGQGKTRGKVAKLGIEATSNQACATVFPSDRFNCDYLLHLLILSYEQLRKLGRGGNQPNLNLSMIKEFEVILPPLDLQNKFAEIVEATEKQRELMERSLALMEQNLKGLMQRAFRGELFN